MRNFTSTDPENGTPGAGIDWDVTGTDADDFYIDARGMLMFNSPPDFEKPTDRLHPDGDDDGTEPDDPAENNMYQITVRATEQSTSGDDPRALSTETDVIVMVTNAEEKGTASMNRLQPEVGTPITVIWDDPDMLAQDPDIAFQWYVSKVTDPLADAPSHWIEATGDVTNERNYLRTQGRSRRRPYPRRR